MHRPTPFRTTEEAKEFSESFIRFTGQLHHQQMLRLIDERNMHIFRHGNGFTYLQEAKPAPSKFESARSDIEIKDDKIRESTEDHLIHYAATFAQGITDECFKGIFREVNTTCESTGNIVKQADHQSIAETHLAMLESIQMSVDEDGKLVLPSCVMAPEQSKKWHEELAKQDNTFHERVNEILKKKHSEALEREKLGYESIRG